MKRIWIGIGLLAAMLVLGIWMAEVMEDGQRLCAKDLRRASEMAMEEQWTQAEALTKRARSRWEKRWKLTASVSDHEPMDVIDGIFAELKIYAATRDGAAYSAACAQLAEQLEALGQAHAASWWNLL